MWEGEGRNNGDAGDGGSGGDSCKVEYGRITNLGLKCQTDQGGINQREAV